MIRLSWFGSSSVLASLAVVGLLTPSFAAEDPPEKDLKAKDIIARVEKAYAACETYRDSGEVSIKFTMETGDRIDIRPFTTSFIRPDRFRYQYQATNPANVTSRFLIWRKGNEVKTWWDVTPGIQKPESLALAIAGATGVSGGSARTVPAMLMPKEVGSFGGMGLTDLKRLDDDKLENVDCFRIEGKFGSSPTTVWIDKKRSVILRIVETHDFGNFNTETTITYKPVIGEKIPDDAFVFDPPKPEVD